MNDNFLSKITPELDGKMVSAGLGKWLYYPNELPLVMQIENLNQGQLLCYVSLSKRREGMFLTSFLTMLMIEESMLCQKICALKPSRDADVRFAAALH